MFIKPLNRYNLPKIDGVNIMLTYNISNVNCFFIDNIMNSINKVINTKNTLI